MGALLGHITGGADATTFQPMNINFGPVPADRRQLQGQGAQAGRWAVRALRDFDDWLKPPSLAAD